MTNMLLTLYIQLQQLQGSGAFQSPASTGPVTIGQLLPWTVIWSGTESQACSSAC